MGTPKPIPIAREWIAAYLWQLDFTGRWEDQPMLTQVKYRAEAEKFMLTDDFCRALQASGWDLGFKAAGSGAKAGENPYLPIDMNNATPYKHR